MKKKTKERPYWLQELAEGNPDMIVWDGFDNAIVGTATRCGMETVLIYNFEKMVKILVKRDKMDREMAVEYLEFNLVGCYAGELTPMTMYPLVK